MMHRAQTCPTCGKQGVRFRMVAGGHDQQKCRYCGWYAFVIDDFQKDKHELARLEAANLPLVYHTAPDLFVALEGLVRHIEAGEDIWERDASGQDTTDLTSRTLAALTVAWDALRQARGGGMK